MKPDISTWKFCKVKQGSKVPYPKDWQNKPLDLDQIPAGDNYGLLSGIHSGILAIDFDGLWAFNWWEENMHISLPNTIAWTSGRENRVQYAYTVPKELWNYIKTVKFNNGIKKPDNEGIEFRWNGLQSVLPPSIHPDTGKEYQWVGNDVTAECPIEILEFLIEKNGKKTPRTSKVATLTPVTSQTAFSSPELAELNKVLTEYKKFYPVLSYDEWRNVTWSSITHCGHLGGIAAMMTFYPEQESGEYDRLADSYVSASAPGIGSLIFAIQQRDANFTVAPKYKDEKLVRAVLNKLNNKRII